MKYKVGQTYWVIKAFPYTSFTNSSHNGFSFAIESALFSDLCDADETTVLLEWNCVSRRYQHADVFLTREKAFEVLIERTHLWVEQEGKEKEDLITAYYLHPEDENKLYMEAEINLNLQICKAKRKYLTPPFENEAVKITLLKTFPGEKEVEEGPEVFCMGRNLHLTKASAYAAMDFYLRNLGEWLQYKEEKEEQL